MGFKKDYPPEFERVWRIYPDWPKGRSKKAEAFKAWQKVLKEGWTPEDTDLLIADIQKRISTQESWQRGHRFGPPAMSTFLNQRIWENDYKTIKRPAPRLVRDNGDDVVVTEEERQRNRERMADLLRSL